MMLVPNLQGGYRFLPGRPYTSFAVLAADGFEIVRARFRRPPRFPEGLADVENHLRSSGRPLHALCGLEFRFGRQSTAEEFVDFNKTYLERMRQAGLLVNDRVPMTRTNVAVAGTKEEHRIHAFSYTMPVSRPAPKQPLNFVVAAIPEVRFASGNPVELVARGDTSQDGLRQKTAFILETLEGRLRALGARWSDVTGIQLYTLHDLHYLLTTMVPSMLAEAKECGIEWHLAQPPVIGLEVEFDVRSTRTELTVET